MAFKVLTVALLLFTSSTSFALENEFLRLFPVKEQVRLQLWYEGVDSSDKKVEEAKNIEKHLPIELIHPLKQWKI